MIFKKIIQVQSLIASDIARRTTLDSEYQHDLTTIQKLASKVISNNNIQNRFDNIIENLNNDDYTTDNGFKKAETDYNKLSKILNQLENDKHVSII